MKRRDLLLGMALFAGFSAQAVTSPFTGSVAGEGTFYLYQVETGLWLEANRSDFNTWTTHSSLNDVGFDVQLKKLDGFEGYQIFCRFTNNGSLNGADEDRFYLDQANRDVTDWIFEPVTVDGVTNAYRIMAKATPEGTGDRSKIANDVYIGAADGQLSDHPTDYTWQLVSRQERLEKMVEDSKKGPVDATWLIPWFDLGRNDMRDREWTHIRNNNQGGNETLGGSNGYPVWEYWHYVTMRRSITLTDLPKGTYSFAIQAYYRDGEIDTDCEQRFLDNEFVPRAKYFAGAAQGDVMSIFADAKDVATDGFDLLMEKSGKYVPNSTGNAALAMLNGNYINEYISAPVSDGTLTIGIEKPEGTFRDWLVTKRMYLRYDGQDLIAEDLTGLQQQLTDLIAKAESLPQTPSFVAALATAREKLTSASSGSALRQAIYDFQAVVDAVNASKDVIGYFNETKAITDKIAGCDATKAVDLFNSALSKGDYENALKELRYARRRAVADKQEDIFPGQPVAEGKFYIYNVGQKQFLCGGSDWGAHAALGMPGVELTLEAENAEAGDFHIETGLFNGEDKHYLGYRGYMDSGKAGAWRFIPVEGKENVYTIHQADYPDVHVAWNPNASVDQHMGDETTVGTECRNLDETDLNAQWKLVTAEERLALLEKATLDNPVDATILMKSPNFNQREDISFWNLGNANVGRRGENLCDFICESYNSDNCDINQMVENMPVGVYVVTVQGYYRNGEIRAQLDLPLSQNAYLYAGNEGEEYLPNITAESGNAPGEGDVITSEDGQTVYAVPNSVLQAAMFFKNGLYKTRFVVEKTDDMEFPIGVAKDEKGEEGDWVVADNFRLAYYGKDTTVDAVKDRISSAIQDIIANPEVERPADDRIFNILGQPVANPTVPGIYIQNGKKFIVR